MIQLGVAFRVKRNGATKAVYQCKCGNKCVCFTASVKAGNTSSCGCRQRALAAESMRLRAVGTTHGKSKTRTYKIWKGMKKRCTNENDKSYSDYGGRGVLLCAEWMTFEGFVASMGEAPEGMSIERKDVNGNYVATNCVWATIKDQSRNKRNNVLATIDGEVKTLVEWCEDDRCHVSYSAIHKRLKRGWPMADAVMKPIGGSR